MIRYTVTENKTLSPIDAKQKGCWVSLIAPTEEEILEASNVFGVDPEALRAALDPEERSRIETDEKYTMILVNIPTIVTANQKELYDTIPLSVILTEDSVITVCSQHSPILRQFEENKVKDFSTAMRSRFLLQILFRVDSLYLQYLRSIDKRSEQGIDRAAPPGKKPFVFQHLSKIQRNGAGKDAPHRQHQKVSGG